MARTATPEEKSCPAGGLGRLPDILREFGHDPWQMLESFGISEAVMARPLTPVPASLQGRVLEAAAKLTQCEHIGLMLGQRATLEHAGPLRLLVVNARTANEAIKYLVRFVVLWYRALHVNYTRNGTLASVSLGIDGNFPGRDHLMVAYLAALIKHLEGVMGRAWRPSSVHIACHQPKSIEPYQRYFRAPLVFDQAQSAVFFRDQHLDDARSDPADRQLEAFLHQYMSELEKQNAPDLISQVKHVILGLLGTSECNIVRIAEIFSVHRFTLYRYLRVEGTTFEALLDETRRDLATELLARGDLPISEISSEVGFATVPSFVRACTRWYGVTPKAMRHHKLGVLRAASPKRVAQGLRDKS
jgi:AraC-like DNA-binding protein